jgi:hypothetical protein
VACGCQAKEAEVTEFEADDVSVRYETRRVTRKPRELSTRDFAACFGCRVTTTVGFFAQGLMVAATGSGWMQDPSDERELDEAASALGMRREPPT